MKRETIHVSIFIEISFNRYGTHSLLLVGVKCKPVTQELWNQAQFWSFDSEFCFIRQGHLSTLFWSTGMKCITSLRLKLMQWPGVLMKLKMSNVKLLNTTVDSLKACYELWYVRGFTLTVYHTTLIRCLFDPYFLIKKHEIYINISQLNDNIFLIQKICAQKRMFPLSSQT